mmetsp:Transcript_124042/g.215068  ORF Transcript_124042/g.215068 Transcript_124042/m.215068 type:complete len:265 (+) Transcript_124042:739-1533(+)
MLFCRKLWFALTNDACTMLSSCSVSFNTVCSFVTSPCVTVTSCPSELTLPAAANRLPSEGGRQLYTTSGLKARLRLISPMFQTLKPSRPPSIICRMLNARMPTQISPPLAQPAISMVRETMDPVYSALPVCEFKCTTGCPQSKPIFMRGPLNSSCPLLSSTSSLAAGSFSKSEGQGTSKRACWTAVQQATQSAGVWNTSKDTSARVCTCWPPCLRASSLSTPVHSSDADSIWWGASAQSCLAFWMPVKHSVTIPVAGLSVLGCE